MPWYSFVLMIAAAFVVSFAMAKGSWLLGKIGLGLVVISVGAAFASLLS